jgi:hypothetical protein
MHRSFRTRALCASVALVASLACAAGASAATTSISFSLTTYPDQLFGVDSTHSTGDYRGFLSAPNFNHPTDVRQVRGGAVISTNDIGTVALAAGDVIQLIDRTTGGLLASTTYSGLPSLDATSCIGQNGFSGRRTADASVSVSTIVPIRRTSGRYSFDDLSRTAAGHVRTLGDGTFGGVFDNAIAAGQFIDVSSFNDTVVNDVETSISVESIVPAGACPPPVPDKTAPVFVTFDLGAPGTPVKAFLRFGLTSFITISEPAAITQKLYLANSGKVPASAARAAATKKKAKKKTKAAKLIGSGKKTTAVAGTVKITVKPSLLGRKLLRGKKRVKVVLVTTAKDAAGNKTTKVKKITLQG